VGWERGTISVPFRERVRQGTQMDGGYSLVSWIERPKGAMVWNEDR
jgi:hypothetical protein